MTAKEAREKTMERREVLIPLKIKEIDKIIENRIYNGHTSFEIEIQRDIYFDVLEHYESLGFEKTANYMVAPFDTVRTLRMSWANGRTGPKPKEPDKALEVAEKVDNFAVEVYNKIARTIRGF